MGQIFMRPLGLHGRLLSTPAMLSMGLSGLPSIRKGHPEDPINRTRALGLSAACKRVMVSCCHQVLMECMQTSHVENGGDPCLSLSMCLTSRYADRCSVHCSGKGPFLCLICAFLPVWGLGLQKLLQTPLCSALCQGNVSAETLLGRNATVEVQVIKAGMGLLPFFKDEDEEAEFVKTVQ